METTFTTSADLLSKIKAELLSKSWNLISETATRIRLKGASYADACFLQIETVSRSSGFQALEIRGSLDETFIAISPALHSVFKASGDNSFTRKDLRYQPNNVQNKLWLSANQSAFALAIFNGSNYPAWRFGFYDRPRIDKDPYAWGYGPIAFGDMHCYVAKSIYDGSNWRQLGSSFRMGSVNGTRTNYYDNLWFASNGRPFKAFMNPYSQCAMGKFIPITAIDNPSANFELGNSNGWDDSIKPFPAWMPELYGIDDSVTQNGEWLRCAFRGTIQFVATGFGHLPIGSITIINDISYLALGQNSAIILIR